MKFRITLKDPDGVYESLKEAAWAGVREVEGITDAERAELAEDRIKELEAKVGKWVEYGEYVSIEIDLDAGTAVVCPVKG